MITSIVIMLDKHRYLETISSITNVDSYYYERAKRTKLLLAVTQTALKTFKNSEKIDINLYDHLGLGESFKTMNWPGPARP